MCIWCEVFGLKHVNRVEPQEGMRGYNEELGMNFEIHDKFENLHRIHANNGEWYAIRSDKITVLLS